MLQLGTRITQPADPLQKISLEQLYQMLRHPKTELADFIQQLRALAAIDLRTHDVTRACFLSADPEAWFNPLSDPVEMAEYLKNLDFEDAVADIREAGRVLREQAPSRTDDPESPSLDGDILQRIKLRLNPNARPRQPKEHYVPPALDEAMPLIRERLAAWEMEVRSAEPIRYGRQVRIHAGRHFAEINIFYGARGFSVVKTTRTGSTPELADLAARAIREILEIP